MKTRTTTQGFFDPATWTVSYVVWDHATERAAVIDPVLDYDFESGHTSTASADRLLAYVRDKGLQVKIGGIEITARWPTAAPRRQRHRIPAHPGECASCSPNSCHLIILIEQSS